MGHQRTDRLSDAPPKNYTIGRVDWWCDKATELARASGFTYRQLAECIERVFGYKTEATNVGRCLQGRGLNIELAGYLSEILGMPRPVIIPRSLIAAEELTKMQTILVTLARTSDTEET